MKKAYLLTFGFTGKPLLMKIIMGVMAFLVTFTLTFAIIYVYDSSRYERYINNYVKGDVSIVSIDEEIAILHEEAILENKMPETNSNYAEYLSRLNELENVLYIGEADQIRAYRDVSEETILINSMSGNIYNHMSLPLEEGSYEQLLQYDPKNEKDSIPCILPYYVLQEYDVGDKFLLTLDFATGLNYTHTDEHGITHAKVKSDMVQREFVVAGRYEKGSLLLTSVNSIGVTEISIEECLMAEENLGFPIIYCPTVLNNGMKIFPEAGITERYIFSEGDIQDNIPAWNNEMRGYARIFSFNSMIKIYKDEYSDGGGSVYVMHAILAALMLLFGVAGYNIMMLDRSKRMYGIYFMCGMKWQYTVLLTVLENVITMIFPGIGGSMLAIAETSSVRFFDFQTKFLSFLTGMGAVGFLCVLSIVSFTVVLYLNKPKGLIGSEEV